LFPEGGGQPCDYGTLNESIQVKNVQRVGTSHVHHVTEPVNEGIEARLALDWKRRLDNMQQHSGQHLLTAVFEQPEYGCDTLAWGMNATRCHVELSKIPTPEQIKEVEERCNLFIRRNYPIQINFGEQRPESLPKDYVGPNGVFRVAQIMEDLDVIAAEENPLDHATAQPKLGLKALDYNPCCGTHVKSLKDLQCVKFLHHEKIRGNNCRLFFVVGQRALNLLQESYQLSRELGTVLAAPGGPETFVETVVKNQKQNKETYKLSRALFKDLAGYLIRDWTQELKENHIIQPDGTDSGYVISYHRDDGDGDYLVQLFHLITDNGLLQDRRIFILSSGDMNEGGPMFIMSKDEALIKRVATEVSKFVEVKGGGKGRWQGKAKSWKGLETAWEAARTLVKSESA
ncbi:Alanyl-tRNA editing protein Aarsd1, partial [Lunasporangiospora selenospora]